jgi:hypothetical protein
MSPLEVACIALASDSVLFTRDEVSRLPNSVWHWLFVTGVFAKTSPAEHIVCSACYEPHVAKVEVLRRKRTQVFIHWCPEAGRVEIAPERLEQWKLQQHALLAALMKAFGLHGKPIELPRGGAWRLGLCRLRNRDVEVFFCVRASDHALTPLPDSALVLTAAQTAVVSCGPIVIPLAQAARAEGDGIMMDFDMIGRLIGLRRKEGGDEKARPDGFYPLRTVVFLGTEHDCDLTKQEGALLSLLIGQGETPITSLMYPTKSAVWRKTYRPTKQIRNQISGALARLNKALMNGTPPLPLRFSLVRSSDSIVRQLGELMTAQ